MIMKNELRINNLVYNHLGGAWEDKIMEVKEIRDDRIIYDRYFTPPLNSDIEDCFECLYCYIIPIPLTEELLVKFGFKNTDKGIILELGHYTDSYFWFNSISGQLRLIESNGKLLTHDNLKYVHQLQNLYFALVGEELESL